MPAWIYKNTSKYRYLLIFLGLLPLVRIFYLGSQDQLTANPIEFITRSTGTWALIFLCLTLSVTPLRKITEGAINLINYRRILGLYVFFYACLHFLIWFLLDHNLDSQEMMKDILKRPFITMGFLSFLLLWPLALTSNQWSVRLLKRHWAQLHRLIYLVSITVIIHYWWHKSGKHDYFSVSIYASIILGLLFYRAWKFIGNFTKTQRGKISMKP
jgi:sulfoxide reductase heme-binding subunit YedZ